LSAIARDAGHPVILVQINYRLGVFGFAASHDLQKEQEESLLSLTSKTQVRTRNLLCNYGFLDQIRAFEWVHKHIKAFGGDCSNITAFGVSAGSASIHFHLLTGNPLFDRAILMSGSAPTMGPRPLDYHNIGWENLCLNSNVFEASNKQRLESLRLLTPEDLIENYAPSPLGPIADENLFPNSWCLDNRRTESRCRSIIIGDTREEAIIHDRLSRSISQKRFRQMVCAAFSETCDSDLFCRHFGFTSENMPYKKYRDAMRLFLSVVICHFPSLMIAKTYKGNAYYYHFEEPSTYEGPTLGIPYHGQCALYLYNNETKRFPESAQRISLKMANLWTSFAYGVEPWELFQTNQRFMRFGPNGVSSLEGFDTDSERNYGVMDWLANHFDEAKNLVHSLY